MDTDPITSTPDIHFMRITVTTMNQICALSETLSPAHRGMVADNVRSIAEAHFSPGAWMRAIYADDIPIGFIMTHTGSDYEDGSDCPVNRGPITHMRERALVVRRAERRNSRWLQIRKLN